MAEIVRFGDLEFRSLAAGADFGGRLGAFEVTLGPKAA